MLDAVISGIHAAERFFAKKHLISVAIAGR
jgi:hypothetical protein